MDLGASPEAGRSGSYVGGNRSQDLVFLKSRQTMTFPDVFFSPKIRERERTPANIVARKGSEYQIPEKVRIFGKAKNMGHPTVYVGTSWKLLEYFRKFEKFGFLGMDFLSINTLLHHFYQCLKAQMSL